MTLTQLQHTRDAIEHIVRLMLFRREQATHGKPWIGDWFLIGSIYMMLISWAAACLSFAKLQIERLYG